MQQTMLSKLPQATEATSTLKRGTLRMKPFCR